MLFGVLLEKYPFCNQTVQSKIFIKISDYPNVSLFVEFRFTIKFTEPAVLSLNIVVKMSL